MAGPSSDHQNRCAGRFDNPVPMRHAAVNGARRGPGAASCVRLRLREGAKRMSAGTAPTQRLKIGMYVPFSERQMQGETPGWADIMAMAQRAEAVGFDSLWVPDHLIQYYEGV